FVGSCVRLPVTRHPPPPDIGNQRNETQNPRLETPLPRSRVSRGETERGWAMGIAIHNDDRSPRRRQEGPRVSYGEAGGLRPSFSPKKSPGFQLGALSACATR